MHIYIYIYICIYTYTYIHIYITGEWFGGSGSGAVGELSGSEWFGRGSLSGSGDRFGTGSSGEVRRERFGSGAV